MATVEKPFLDGYAWWPISGRPGGTYTNESPWKLLLHTIEGSVAGALAMYNKGVGCPHLTVDLTSRTLLQHVPLNKSSYALRNKAGGTETNRDNVIQVEIAGFAALSPFWSADKLNKLAFDVIVPVLEAVPGIQWNWADHWSGSYGEANEKRWSAQEWDEFSGILGHQHAPENTHWDPGAINVELLRDIVEGDAGMYLASDTTTNEHWVISEGKARKISKPADLKWVGPIRQSASMRYLIPDLMEVV
jgi:hypothetical protein